jgi:membrane fusion protein (multidrug efflux system)
VPLATIQNLDPIYVDVAQSTAELNRLKQALASGRLNDQGTDQVALMLEDGTAYPHVGTLKFRDVTVEPTTGSVILRIEVPNPDAVLLPGMFVRAVLEEGVQEAALLVSQQAVSRNAKGQPVALVLTAANQVEQRVLTADRALGDRWLVTAGLAAGDRVITAGLQRVRPGMTVRLAAPPAATASPAPAPTAATPTH